jgi:hypothetical protein
MVPARKAKRSRRLAVDCSVGRGVFMTRLFAWDYRFALVLVNVYARRQARYARYESRGTRATKTKVQLGNGCPLLFKSLRDPRY